MRAVNAPRGAPSRSFMAAVAWTLKRYCGHCRWIRDYLGRRVCYSGGQMGRTVQGDEDATFCDDYEEAEA